MLPGQERAAEVIRVDIKALQSGRLSSERRAAGRRHHLRAACRDWSTCSGRSTEPGRLRVPERGPRCLQALSLAGGVTEYGAMNRIRVARVVDGKKTEVRVKLDDVVLPGDTIIVPERFF